MVSVDILFKEFFDFCSSVLVGENPKILDLILHRFDECQNEFRNSQEMVNLLKGTKRKMEEEETRLFVHLKEFTDVLKKYRKSKKKGGDKKRKRQQDDGDREHCAISQVVSEEKNDYEGCEAKKRKVYTCHLGDGHISQAEVIRMGNHIENTKQEIDDAIPSEFLSCSEDSLSASTSRSISDGAKKSISDSACLNPKRIRVFQEVSVVIMKDSDDIIRIFDPFSSNEPRHPCGIQKLKRDDSLHAGTSWDKSDSFLPCSVHLTDIHRELKTLHDNEHSEIENNLNKEGNTLWDIKNANEDSSVENEVDNTTKIQTDGNSSIEKSCDISHDVDEEINSIGQMESEDTLVVSRGEGVPFDMVESNTSDKDEVLVTEDNPSVRNLAANTVIESSADKTGVESNDLQSENMNIDFAISKQQSEESSEQLNCKDVDSLSPKAVDDSNSDIDSRCKKSELDSVKPNDDPSIDTLANNDIFISDNENDNASTCSLPPTPKELSLDGISKVNDMPVLDPIDDLTTEGQGYGDQGKVDADCASNDDIISTVSLSKLTQPLHVQDESVCIDTSKAKSNLYNGRSCLSGNRLSRDSSPTSIISEEEIISPLSDKQMASSDGEIDQSVPDENSVMVVSDRVIDDENLNNSNSISVSKEECCRGCDKSCDIDNNSANTSSNAVVSNKLSVGRYNWDTSNTLKKKIESDLRQEMTRRVPLVYLGDVRESKLSFLGNLSLASKRSCSEGSRANIAEGFPSYNHEATNLLNKNGDGDNAIASPSISTHNAESDSADEFTSAQTSNFRSVVADAKAKGKKPPSERHVKKLEQLLEKLRDEIEKGRELSLEDMDQEDSFYIYEDKLKKKFVAAWSKLCEITSRTVTTGRPTERTIRYDGTRYREINRRLEKFLNKRKMFPDFQDVKTIIKLTNKKCNLHLSAQMINDIAREAFVDIGEMLQTRRHQDFIASFGSWQTDQYSSQCDPAFTDPELRRKLEKNRKVGRSNLDAVINKYTELQYSKGTVDESDDDDDDDDDDQAKKSKHSKKRKKHKKENRKQQIVSSDEEEDEALVSFEDGKDGERCSSPMEMTSELGNESEEKGSSSSLSQDYTQASLSTGASEKDPVLHKGPNIKFTKRKQFPSLLLDSIEDDLYPNSPASDVDTTSISKTALPGNMKNLLMICNPESEDETSESDEDKENDDCNDDDGNNKEDEDDDLDVLIVSSDSNSDDESSSSSRCVSPASIISLDSPSDNEDADVLETDVKDPEIIMNPITEDLELDQSASKVLTPTKKRNPTNNALVTRMKLSTNFGNEDDVVKEERKRLSSPSIAALRTTDLLSTPQKMLTDSTPDVIIISDTPEKMTRESEGENVELKFNGRNALLGEKLKIVDDKNKLGSGVANKSSGVRNDDSDDSSICVIMDVRSEGEIFSSEPETSSGRNGVSTVKGRSADSKRKQKREDRSKSVEVIQLLEEDVEDFTVEGSAESIKKCGKLDVDEKHGRRFHDGMEMRMSVGINVETVGNAVVGKRGGSQLEEKGLKKLISVSKESDYKKLGKEKELRSKKETKKEGQPMEEKEAEKDQEMRKEKETKKDEEMRKEKEAENDKEMRKENEAEKDKELRKENEAENREELRKEKKSKREMEAKKDEELRKDKEIIENIGVDGVEGKRDGDKNCRLTEGDKESCKDVEEWTDGGKEVSDGEMDKDICESSGEISDKEEESVVVRNAVKDDEEEKCEYVGDLRVNTGEKGEMENAENLQRRMEDCFILSKDDGVRNDEETDTEVVFLGSVEGLEELPVVDELKGSNGDIEDDDGNDIDKIAEEDEVVVFESVDGLSGLPGVKGLKGSDRDEDVDKSKRNDEVITEKPVGGTSDLPSGEGLKESVMEKENSGTGGTGKVEEEGLKHDSAKLELNIEKVVNENGEDELNKKMLDVGLAIEVVKKSEVMEKEIETSQEWKENSEDFEVYMDRGDEEEDEDDVFKSIAKLCNSIIVDGDSNTDREQDESDTEKASDKKYSSATGGDDGVKISNESTSAWPSADEVRNVRIFVTDEGERITMAPELAFDCLTRDEFGVKDEADIDGECDEDGEMKSKIVKCSRSKEDDRKIVDELMKNVVEVRKSPRIKKRKVSSDDDDKDINGGDNDLEITNVEFVHPRKKITRVSLEQMPSRADTLLTNGKRLVTKPVESRTSLVTPPLVPIPKPNRISSSSALKGSNIKPVTKVEHGPGVVSSIPKEPQIQTQPKMQGVNWELIRASLPPASNTKPTSSGVVKPFNNPTTYRNQRMTLPPGQQNPSMNLTPSPRARGRLPITHNAHNPIRQPRLAHGLNAKNFAPHHSQLSQSSKQFQYFSTSNRQNPSIRKQTPMKMLGPRVPIPRIPSNQTSKLVPYPASTHHHTAASSPTFPSSLPRPNYRQNQTQNNQSKTIPYTNSPRPNSRQFSMPMRGRPRSSVHTLTQAANAYVAEQQKKIDGLVMVLDDSDDDGDENKDTQQLQNKNSPMAKSASTSPNPGSSAGNSPRSGVPSPSKSSSTKSSPQLSGSPSNSNKSLTEHLVTAVKTKKTSGVIVLSDSE